MATPSAGPKKKTKKRKWVGEPVSEGVAGSPDQGKDAKEAAAPLQEEGDVEIEGAAAGEGADRAYRSAAVAFFTRNEQGEVSHVLVAQEERKVQASILGLDKKGKVNQQMVVLPMGRREKKDKNDCVETVKREYIEETTDFGGLAKYLDFADFDGGAEEEEEVDRGETEWTGKQNLALFFAPAAMAVLFCEVPTASRTGQGQEEPAAKKQRQEEPAAAPRKPSPNYHVGKMDHLLPYWITAAELRTAVESTDKAPLLKADAREGRVFPTVASALRHPEARAWLGLVAKAA
jgi:hypothetical protein